MYIRLLSLFLLLTQTAIAQVTATAPIVIANKTNYTVSAYYLDQLYYGKPLSISANGHTNIVEDQPVYILLANSKQYFVKAFPGDTIVVKEQKNEVVFMPQQPLNQLYNTIFTAIGPLRYTASSPITKQLSLAQRDSFINGLKLQRLAIFQQNKKILSDDEQQEALSLIEAAAIAEKIRLNAPKISDTSIKNYYRDSLSVFIQTLNHTQNNSLNPLLLEAAVKIWGQKKEQNAKLDSWLFINNEFKGGLKTFMLARWLKSALVDSGFTLSKISMLFKEKMPAITDTIYRSILWDELRYRQQTSQLSGKGTYFFTPHNSSVALDVVLQQNKGKVIFIDCWASWCVPCLEEIPNTLALQSAFSKKDIAFVFLSLDANKKDWLNKLATFDTIFTNNSYLLANGFSSAFAKKYGIKSIPRYMIIGKNGKVIDPDAPRPSEPKLKTILAALLRK